MRKSYSSLVIGAIAALALSSSMTASAVEISGQVTVSIDHVLITPSACTCDLTVFDLTGITLRDVDLNFGKGLNKKATAKYEEAPLKLSMQFVVYAQPPLRNYHLRA